METRVAALQAKVDWLRSGRFPPVHATSPTPIKALEPEIPSAVADSISILVSKTPYVTSSLRRAPSMPRDQFREFQYLVIYNRDSKDVYSQLLAT
jgi:hypothetical protein